MDRMPEWQGEAAADDSSEREPPSQANLEDTELLETHLDGADLRKAKNLTCEQIEDAYIDRSTKFPDYLEISWTNDDTFTCKINS